MNAEEIIEQLQLLPHPEGGYYKETYRAEEVIITRQGSSRNVCTSIYFLLEKNDKSHFHRIKSDELWFFHQGEPVELLYILDGTLHSVILGNSIEKGEEPQFKVPANTWFASNVKTGINYSLVSCTVSPGFDFADFELAERNRLISDFPLLENTIKEFTRG